MITQERLKQLLAYNPESGVFVHLTNTTHKRIGDVAGYKHSRGYRYIRCDGIEYFEHRLAFLYMEGYFPEEVDHKDRVRDNNKWDNLREADRHINCTNQGLRKDNQTGVKGLSQAKDSGKWVYRKQINKQQFRWSFKTRDEAITFIENKQWTFPN